jgi:hypothetical protein
MLSRPSTDQVIDAIADDLAETIGPALDDEAAIVLVGQAEQLLRRLARRAAHEIGWMTEEIAAIDIALGRTPDPVDSWHLDAVLERYSAASGALADAIEAAFAAGDSARVAELKALLDQRILNEQEILGTLELVGRG